MEFEHIHPNLQDKPSLSDAERIKWIQTERFITYKKASEMLERLNYLFHYPKRDRMPCLLICGRSGIGKTLILRKFIKDAEGTSRDTYTKPVVAIQMPVIPEEKRFYEEILISLEAPFNFSSPSHVLKNLCRKLLRDLDVKILVIDEIHSIFVGTARQQRVIFNTLRYLTNDLKIPIVCAGIEEAKLALAADAQLADRFEVQVLREWKSGKEYASLINTLSKSLPLRKPSELCEPEALELLLSHTQGVTLRIFRTIEHLATAAIKSGDESIKIADIKDFRFTPLVSME
eukprot:TRINITY_DN32116_c0_g1_i1.p2 TRINITY_DN32116_c0_g1~~TRINITY_DN32116_c0_g1_i1.p2  ORF type:complete len:288 (-),score=-40.57 TRINITY_DN32116_c0_g1_i1:480-1343(-)